MSIRKTAGGVLIVVGVLGIAAFVVLVVFMAVAIPDMSRAKVVSESLTTALIAAWWAGFVVAGRVLRRP
ncbi:MAG: hypothetical protein M3445_05815 [Actinomycetota bacterium]|nr:hypothetical protein [Actinomycetota bacterium]